MDYEAIRAQLDAAWIRQESTYDVIGTRRADGDWIPAEHCPGCGRWARAEAGNPGEIYWIVTDCKKCGRYECRDVPLFHRNNQYTDKTPVITKLAS